MPGSLTPGDSDNSKKRQRLLRDRSGSNRVTSMLAATAGILPEIALAACAAAVIAALGRGAALDVAEAAG